MQIVFYRAMIETLQKGQEMKKLVLLLGLVAVSSFAYTTDTSIYSDAVEFNKMIDQQIKQRKMQQQLDEMQRQQQQMQEQMQMQRQRQQMQQYGY